jgi:hypothetical protein
MRQVLVSVALLSALAGSARADDPCGTCPRARLMFFDFQPPAGTSAADAISLSSTSGGAFSSVWKSAAKSCLHMLTAGYNAVTQKVKYPVPIYADAGAISGADFIVTGAMTASGGKYQLAISVEDAVTRDVVATAKSAPFQRDDDLAAAEKTMGSLGDMRTVIATYQKKLRDQKKSAIAAHLEITGYQPELEVNKSTTLQLELKDCDGTPLAGRAIALTASAGSISPATVTTDKDGKATATFKAPNSAALVSILGRWKYTSVWHHDTNAGAQVAISVLDPKTDVWQMDLRITQTNTTTVNYYALIAQPEEKFSQNQQIATTVETAELLASFWVTGDQDANGDVTTRDVKGWIGSGTYTMDHWLNNTIYFDGNIQRRHESGHMDGDLDMASVAQTLAFRMMNGKGLLTANGMFHTQGTTEIYDTGQDPKLQQQPTISVYPFAYMPDLNGVPMASDDNPKGTRVFRDHQRHEDPDKGDMHGGVVTDTEVVMKLRRMRLSDLAGGGGADAAANDKPSGASGSGASSTHGASGGTGGCADHTKPPCKPSVSKPKGK